MVVALLLGVLYLRRREVTILIPANGLTDFDYEILEKVSKYPTIEERLLIESFPKQAAAQLRITFLSQSDYREILHGHRLPIPDTSYIEHIYAHIQDESGADDSVYTGKLRITPLGLKTLEEWRRQKKKEHRKLVEWRITKYAPIIISIIALIVAIISLLQSLHWIHLEQSEILPVPPSQADSRSSTDAHSSTQPLQSP